ncbi:MAG: acyl-CoA dehydrogenase [Deltaproteobacteria bacterium]|nr:acyl-CoA dehydrogenase [Deltaproteobacteria bacterium]
MPDREFNLDLRDIRFALFEGVDFAQLGTCERFSESDQESIELLLNEAAKFHRDVIAPIDGPGDKEGCRFEDGKVFTPKGFGDAYRAICENGWLGISAGEELGGMGLPTVVEMAVGEMQVGACCSLSLSVGLTNGAAGMLAEFATEEIKKAYLPKLIAGTWQGTMCLTEAQAGSAVGDIKTVARKEGDQWYVTGTKVFITSGDHDMCENHVHLVLAHTQDAPKGIKGLSLFVVPKYLPNAQGNPGDFNDVVCAGIEHKMGIHGSATCVLSFGDDDKCKAFLVGEECQGIRYMFHMMNHARLGVTLQGVGLAAQAYNYAFEYAKERIQGVDIEKLKDPNAERVAIVEHPDVKRMLMWQKAMVEGCRALLYETAFYQDIANGAADEKARTEAQNAVEFLTPVCKAYSSDQGFEVTRLAIQVMGGYGYVAEYPVERHMRDIKIASIYEGSNGIQALDLLGRKLTTKAGLYFRQMLQKMQGWAKDNKEHVQLEGEIETLAKGIDNWSRTTMTLGMKGMQGDRRYPVLCATPYLEMTGNVIVAWLLLKQAVIAHDKLEALHTSEDAQDWETRDQLYAQDPESRYYYNKIETARFFVHNIMLRNRGIAEQIKSEDRSALNLIV